MYFYRFLTLFSHREVSTSRQRTETSSRMRILRNIHNMHVRGGQGRGRGRGHEHVHGQERAENTTDNLYHSPEGVGLNAVRCLSTLFLWSFVLAHKGTLSHTSGLIKCVLST